MYSQRLSDFDSLGDGTVAIFNGAMSIIPAGTTGQLLVASTGNNPAFATLVPADINFVSSTSGGTRTVLINNTSNTLGSSAVAQVKVAGTSAADPRLLLSIGGATDWCVKSNNVGSQQFVVAHSTSGTTAQYLLVDTTGNLTTPSNSNVLVYNNAGAANQTGDGSVVTLVLDTEIADRNNNFSANTFTAPVTSIYQVNVTICLTGLTVSHTASVFQINTSNRNWQTFAENVGAGRDISGNLILSFSAEVDMDAADTMTVSFNVSGGGKGVGWLGVSGTTQRTYLSVSNQ